MNAADILQRFDSLPFQLEVELGTLTMSIGEIFDLQEGTVLRTGHPAGTPFTLRAGGVELATAQIVVLDNCVSVRIDKLMESTKAQIAGNGTD
jgi:flagellar motor switch/type III secretory pathway protein FliN